MFEAVRAWPDGTSTVARLALTADEYEYDGVVVRNRADARPDYEAEQITAEYGVDVVDGVEIHAASPSQASGSVGNFRPKCTVVAVRGGTPELNRFAVENERVDVLTAPMFDDGDFNHVLAKAAVENRVCVEFNFSSVLRTDGGPRVQALKDMRKLREIVEKYDVPFVVSTDAESHLQLRAPRELRAVGAAIGFEPDQITAGLNEWRVIAARNREREAEGFIEPGVERGTYDGA